MALSSDGEPQDSVFPHVHADSVLRRDPAGVRPSNPDAAGSRGCREVEASKIAANILRAAHRLRGLLAGHFSEFGLSDVRFAVLQVLQNCSTGGCTQAELAAELDQSESSVSALVERMRDDNLLYRLRSKTDRRKRVLVLTEQGRQILARVELRHGERVAALLAPLSDAQFEELARLLRLLVDELARAEPITESAAESSWPSIPHLGSALESIQAQPQEQHRPVA